MQFSMNGDTFRIRAYGRTELALLYCPGISGGAAWRRFSSWIATAHGLTDRLAAMGYRESQRIFTPSQVSAIVEALGEP